MALTDFLAQPNRTSFIEKKSVKKIFFICYKINATHFGENHFSKLHRQSNQGTMIFTLHFQNIKKIIALSPRNL